MVSVAIILAPSGAPPSANLPTRLYINDSGIQHNIKYNNTRPPPNISQAAPDISAAGNAINAPNANPPNRRNPNPIRPTANNRGLHIPRHPPNPHRHTNPYAHCRAHANPYAHCRAHANPYAHTYTHANPYTHTYAHANPYTHTYAHAANFLSRR